VFVDGVYHLFFQHNPYGIQSGNLTWGHAISRDLVHWKQLPNAIKPDAMGPIWSGSAVVDWNNTAGFQSGKHPAVVAVYTAAGGTSAISRGKPFTQCLAYSNDNAMTLTKFSGNPVLEQLVPGNRDPKVFWHEPSRHWIMPLFLDASHGFALLKSPNLKHWEKTQEWKFPQSQECPNMFPLSVTGEPENIHWIFTGANGQYLIGSFNGETFQPHSGPFAMDTGNNFYASQIFSDIPRTDGRTIQITWMRGGKYPGMPFNQQMGFPCELILRRTVHGLRVCRYPVKEISRLYRHSRHYRNVPIPEGVPAAANPFDQISGELLDLDIVLHAGRAQRIEAHVGGHRIIYDPRSGIIRCLGATGRVLTRRGHLRLRVLADRTSVEVFANGGEVSMTSCTLPKTHKAALALTAHGGDARVISMAAHELRSAWHQA
jgi:sucrose-6-phosphate hydrolase SacC (GH32 family)